jgi:HAD superfamily hydrolase (TIGR01450 family)
MRVCEDSAMTTHDAPQLRSALAGVRALLLDMDGVVVMRGRPIPGAAEALARLDAAGIPYVLATNTSMLSRLTLARELTRGGMPVEEEAIVTAASATAAYVRRRFGEEPIYLMVAPDALVEFEGLTLLSHDDAADPDARAAAVVVGDAGEEFTPRNLQSAFTLLRGAAAFVAMHKNRWWFTPAGVMMDSGAYVTGLEYATERRALVTGKPSRAFFEEGVRRLDYLAAARAAGLRGSSGTAAWPRLAPGEVAMVGDDLWNDILGAQKAGLRGIFVRSGKHGDAELARVASGRGGRAPDAVAPSIVEIVEALLG